MQFLGCLPPLQASVNILVPGQKMLTTGSDGQPEVPHLSVVREKHP